MAIREIDEKRYDEALGILPPRLWLANRFLMGEPSDYRKCTISNKVLPTYSAFFAAFGRYYESDPMTEPEFRAFKNDALPPPK